MSKEEYYYKLIQNLKMILLGYGAAELIPGSLGDRLQCELCGVSDGPKTEGPESHLTQEGRERFIITEVWQKDHFYKNQSIRLRVYSFICLNCGLWQIAIKRKPCQGTD